MTRRPPAPDQAERDAFVRARGVNVVGDAGAGTGKTTLLVDRLLNLVAPDDDGPALSLARVAAITFTRKAAGELKLRIRQALLGRRARADVTPLRRDRLAAALAALDTAWVGTIHAFAHRLLRQRPVEARLPPSYEVVDDGAELAAQTFEVLLQAVQAGTLAAELTGAGIPEPDLLAAQAALVDALRAGLRAEKREYRYTEIPGLDRLVERLILTRDVEPVVPPAEMPDLSRFRDLVDEYAGLAAASSGSGHGSTYIRVTRARLERVRDEVDPVVILKAIHRSAPPRRLKKRDDFPDDDAGWALFKALLGDDGKKRLRDGSLYRDLLDPFARWMVRRLVAAGPAVLAAYERVKARHRVLDQVDLLLRLRNLLRDRLDVRAHDQALFDHVMVDEFQDTDPLQAEIVLYLCEQGAAARDWRQVSLAPGKLTIVGDPKQSIYRFRRADISVYDEVRRIVERGPNLVSRLTANFRCQPGLIQWLNGRFDDLLGTLPANGRAFDPDAGTVANGPLLAGRDGAARACVEVLPLAGKDARVATFREAEARALAAWLRRLVRTKRTVVDADSGKERPVGYRDVAVLAFATTNLPLLFPELDRLGVPYAARGGSLFLEDPLHRQFLLGLRAIADRDDGVAQAALLRAPFFALDYDDLARALAPDAPPTDPGVQRARAARALVEDLRRQRLDRPPGSTARDLLERTAFGRAAALGPNGAQRLEALRELCLCLDAAAAEGLDYDGATARLRGWIEHPAQLDPPPPVWDDAVQVLTVHQAKGLEFPVVVLWDSCTELEAREVGSAFAVERTGASWAVAFDGIELEEPEGGGFAGREKRYLDAERKRLVYVAATRARDLLLLPVAGQAGGKYVTGRLVAGAPEALMERLETYDPRAEPAWAREDPAPAPPPPGDASPLAAEVAAAWRSAAAESARPRFSPAGVAAESHAAVEDDRPGETNSTRPERKSRFGRLFGDAVHMAIGLSLRDPSLDPAAAVARAAAAVGLGHRHAEAAEDVARALAALEKAGLRRPPGPELRLEYPVALAREGRLLAGYLDLVAAEGGSLAVVDFKTDAPPAGDVAETHPAYVEQVRTYARMLEELELAPPGTVRAGLLFTGEEAIRWVGRG
ncbi:MAG TPA: UvrD-helicase domain-containing protein [Anaeromyxobacteraceae bacterium]|nr:UvrD-helicase domain-containing protein [Anaeromyxobacteraceae bacterium]